MFHNPNTCVMHSCLDKRGLIVYLKSLLCDDIHYELLVNNPLRCYNPKVILYIMDSHMCRPLKLFIKESLFQYNYINPVGHVFWHMSCDEDRKNTPNLNEYRYSS